MNRFFGFVPLLSLIYIGALILGFLNYTSKEMEEIEQLRLSYTIDYASDAAVQEMLSTGNLNMDYSEEKYLDINPLLGLETFVNLFCFNYNLGLTEENKAHVRMNYIPAAAVSTFNGYYIAEQKLVKNSTNYPENSVNDGDWDLVFGPKYPYTYTYDDKIYALNMGLDYCTKLDPGIGMSRYNGMPPKSGGTLSREEGYYYINNSISMDMAYAIDKSNENNAGWSHSFFIPSQVTSLSGTNPIRGLSFIALVQNVDLTTVKPIHAFSVAGSAIDYVRSIAAYTVNGKQYYCYADKRHYIAAAHGVNSSSVIMVDMYSTVKEAALKGFNFDIRVDEYQP